MSNCPKCGKLLSPGVQFCSGCGNRLSAPAPAPAVNAPRPQPKMKKMAAPPPKPPAPGSPGFVPATSVKKSFFLKVKDAMPDMSFLGDKPKKILVGLLIIVCILAVIGGGIFMLMMSTTSGKAVAAARKAGKAGTCPSFHEAVDTSVYYKQDPDMIILDTVAYYHTLFIYGSTLLKKHDGESICAIEETIHYLRDCFVQVYPDLDVSLEFCNAVPTADASVCESSFDEQTISADETTDDFAELVEEVDKQCK